ncbi:MAG: ribonuclease H [Desulfobacteraceae bacterium]|nr:ribonuclease H [Desulfobacteraceae bacterium]
MDELKLFTDGSVNTRSKVGYGAYLAVSDPGQSLAFLRTCVVVKRFENTSSTKLELETLLWAMNDIRETEKKVVVYTDSQNIMGLRGRRDRLEQTDYRSKNNEYIANHLIYQAFYGMIDRLACDLVKVCGHQASDKKNKLEMCFTLVDRASRKALRRFAACSPPSY